MNIITRVIKCSNVRIFADGLKLLNVVDRLGDRTNLQLNRIVFIQSAQKHSRQLTEIKHEVIHLSKKAELNQPYIIPSSEVNT